LASWSKFSSKTWPWRAGASEAAAHLREASDRDGAPARYQSLTERTERLENLGRMERRAVRMYNSSFKAFKEYRVDRRRER
jgi:hypothetical protein